MPKISREFAPHPGPQTAFWKCPSRIIGYGGAMGGGKSRAFCEKALEIAVDCPGVPIVIARQSHTSIVETTKKTMMEEVLPPGIIEAKKASMGEDWVRLFNGSVFHFIGLDDPVRWYSAQIGVLMVDQVEECSEDTIVKLMTRLRHPKAPNTLYNGRLGIPDEDGKLQLTPVEDFPLAGRCYLSFNPENPGHWLMGWFFDNAERTQHGFKKPELYATDATFPLGDAEFFFAKATDNPSLPPGYIEAQLAGMPPHLRRRYLDGLWEFISGNCFFSSEALMHYEEIARKTIPVINGRTSGDVEADLVKRVRGGVAPKEKIKILKGEGPLAVWKPPVRQTKDDAGKVKPAHRYVIGVDVASGKAADYTAMQVVSVEDFEVVARFQGKLDPDQAAVEAYRLGRIYNDALIVPEITGGWGFSLEQELKRLRYPRLYTRRVLDRLTKRWTDKTGWDTTVRMRAHMLDTLERVLRERELGLYDLATINELGTFVMNDNGKPEAQPGCNDDLVTSLAVAVTVAVDMPRQLRRVREEPHRPQFDVTGY